MDSAADSLGLIAEVLTWVCLIAGPVLFVIGAGLALAARRWEETSGLLLGDDPLALTVRWMSGRGQLHERTVLPGELPDGALHDDLVLYYDRIRPEHARFDSPRHEGRALRVSGLILLGVGAAAALGQFILVVSAG